MKKVITTLLLGAAAIVGASAQDYAPAMNCCEQSHDWYVSATGSFGWPTQSKVSSPYKGFKLHQKHQWGTMLAVGHIVDQWRLELEGGYRRTKLDKEIYITTGDKTKLKKSFYDSYSLMGNVYYDIPVAECMDVYVGAGAGMAWVRGQMQDDVAGSKKEKIQKRTGRFAAQAMTGIAYHLTDDVDLTLGYRFFYVPASSVKRISSNNIEIGVRYKF